jgi:hypothetical protein
VRRVDFGGVAVLVGDDAEALAEEASALRLGERRRVAVFVVDQSLAEDCSAVEAFGVEQFGDRS